MTQTKNRFLELGALGSGCSVALLAIACGSNGDGAASPSVDACDDDPAAAGCQGIDVTPTRSAGDQGGGGPGAGSGETPGEEAESEATPEGRGETPSEADLQRALAESILRTKCGQCHGSNLNELVAQGGMNYIDDVDALVQNGKLVPLQPGESLIVQYMLDDSMPPPGVSPRPTPEEIQVVLRFVESPENWPGYEPPEPRRSCDNQLIEFDDLYRTVQVDLIGQDVEDRPFLRYLTLTNRYNAGVCAQWLDPERWAMSKLVNMLSVKSSVRQPLSVESQQVIYRIDIRDYGWDREVVVEGETFADGWEAIIAASPYAVPFVGDEADLIRADTGTDVPIMYSDALLDVAALGNLYYALIDIDVDQSLDDFIALDLGIDVVANLDQERLVRAGTTRSSVSRQDRVVERHDIEVRQGAFWQSFDFEANENGESIFQDPFGFNEGGTEAIFTLPNGLLGFLIADADRNIVEQSNILIDQFQNDFVARTAVSCSNCHAQGFNLVQDEVRDFVERNKRDFLADEYEAVQDTYPSAAELAEIIGRDSTLYQGSLGRAGVPIDARDPVGQIFIRFDLDLDLAAAAGDLGVRADDLRSELSRLDPALRVVETLTIDRDDFTALFEASLCEMQGFSRNQPDPERCALVLEGAQ